MFFDVFPCFFVLFTNPSLRMWWFEVRRLMPRAMSVSQTLAFSVFASRTETLGDAKSYKILVHQFGSELTGTEPSITHWPWWKPGLNWSRSNIRNALRDLPAESSGEALCVSLVWIFNFCFRAQIPRSDSLDFIRFHEIHQRSPWRFMCLCLQGLPSLLEEAVNRAGNQKLKRTDTICFVFGELHQCHTGTSDDR